MRKFVQILIYPVDLPLRALGRLGEALQHIRLGLHYGFPLCCVMHFAVGDLCGARKQALRRGGIRLGDDHGFVPCGYHKKRHPEWKSYYERAREKGWLRRETSAQRRSQHPR